MGNRKKKVIVNFILDETASMIDVRDATIDGFNEYKNTLIGDERTNYLFSLTKFNSEKVDTVYVCEPIKKVENLTQETYNPGNMTPLYDAIGQTVEDTEKRLKEIRGKPSVLCVVQTDGYENCSRNYNLAKIQSLISEKEQDGWTFVYLGANQDAWNAGAQIGINASNTLSYTNDTVQVNTAFTKLGNVTVQYADEALVGVSNTAFFTSDGTAADIRDESDPEFIEDTSVTTTSTTIEDA